MKTNNFDESLNRIIVETFRTVLKIEERYIKAYNQALTINEIHILESISRRKGASCKISDIAADLCITLSTVTIAINKLVKKNCVIKKRGEKDGREVYVELAPLGRQIDREHDVFHREMVSRISKQMTNEEKEIITKTITKLNGFFNKELLDLSPPSIKEENE